MHTSHRPRAVFGLWHAPSSQHFFLILPCTVEREILCASLGRDCLVFPDLYAPTHSHFTTAKFTSAATSKAAMPDEAADVHLVLPRRKAGQLDTPEREAVVVTPEILSSLFQHPLAVASQKLVGLPP